MAKTSKGLDEAVVTRMQEIGSAWVFKRAIQDNAAVNWHKWQDLKKDTRTFNEIKKVWKTIGKVDWIDNIDDEWLENFYKQQAELLQKIGRPNFTEFSRDGGPRGSKYILPGSRHNSETFMDWVSKYVKDEFSIGTKDNWNPADIWLIQNEVKWKKKLIKETSMKGMKKTPGLIEANLRQFNSIFRALFRTKQVIGISLKKIGKGQSAVWKEVNVDNKFFKHQQATEMVFDEAICKCGTKPININKKGMIDLAKEDYAKRKGKEKGLYRGLTGLATLETQDSRIIVKHGSKEYSFQIKTTSSTSYDNLKFEPTEKTKGAARMGKATREYVFDLMDGYKFLGKWPKTHDKYPKNIEEFDGVDYNTYEFTGKQKEYLEKLEFLNKEGVDLGVPTALEALINIKETFGPLNQPYVANSKLQQINFLWAFLSTCTTQKERNKFCTDLVFLACKEGTSMDTRYGPFGKIY